MRLLLNHPVAKAARWGKKVHSPVSNGYFMVLILIPLIQKVTIYPRSNDPFYIVTYYMKWVTTSWTDGTIFLVKCALLIPDVNFNISNLILF